MKTYRVKSGDTLGTIALQQLGKVSQWREIAALNDILKPDKIKVGQVLELPDTSAPEASTQKSDVIISVENRNIYYHYQDDMTKRYLGRKQTKGLSRRGNQNTEQFIQHNTKLLSKLKISKSERNALLAVSENEGNLDAINTYDNSFLSFGMFQWTVGARSTKGELAALIKLLAEKYPKLYEQYCGQFGLGFSADTNTVDGYLVYQEKKMDTPKEKQFFRENIVVYRFAMAGMHKEVNAVQVLHAINRFNRFYFVKSKKLGGYTLFDLLSSEYAAALFLDNHVNRPGYLLSCVAKAVKTAQLSFDELHQNGEKHAPEVLKHYLAIRAVYGAYPMTDAHGRAAVVKQFVEQGELSTQQGSFQSNRAIREKM